jgi:hypothetical protein
MSEDDQPATKGDVQALRFELVDRMHRFEGQQITLRSEVAGLRNSFWLCVVVPSLTLIVSLVIHYIFH